MTIFPNGRMECQMQHSEETQSLIDLYITLSEYIYQRIDKSTK